MIIRKVQIENFLCYFDTNTFEFSDGLNIILGENGEGKTKFFESVEWLFNGENRELELLVSAKKLNETSIGESFLVKVSMTVEQYDAKSIISKSFTVRKESDSRCSTSNYMIQGIEENSFGERNQVDGQSLLDRVFPYQIRKYSMFKGESELNIFENENALTNLINLFSEAKHYEKYSEKGLFLRDKAEKAVEQSTRQSQKNQRDYDLLEGEIKRLEREIDKYKVHLNSTDEEIRKISTNLQNAEKHVDNAEVLETLNKRIKSIEEKISNNNSKIDENYTTSLFDENWILVNFESIQNEFSQKIAQHSINRRELQSNFDKQKGIKEGVKKAKADLLNNIVPLPIGVPSKSHIEEMINSEICKVCNREAKKGSEPYEFMMTRLREYLESQSTPIEEAKEEELLFKFNFTNRLENLNIKHEDNLKNLRLIRSKIVEQFKFNDSRKKEIEELTDQLNNEKDERSRLLGNSIIAEESLVNVLKNYNNWQNDLKNKNKDQVDYSLKIKSLENDLKLKKEEKDKIDTNSANSFLIKTRNILRDIELIFNDTKDKKFDEFIEKLEMKSNKFLDRINVDSFTGEISIFKKHRSDRVIVDVQLMQNGRPFYKPNESLETSMYISILFAISELAFETKN
jgi:DNA sulfur modification protein DndD